MHTSKHPLAITELSGKVRRRAKKLGVSYEFLFMHASGEQLRQISRLVDDGVLRPVVGRVVPFDQTVTALKDLNKVSVHGKTVITVSR